MRKLFLYLLINFTIQFVVSAQTIDERIQKIATTAEDAFKNKDTAIVSKLTTKVIDGFLLPPSEMQNVTFRPANNEEERLIKAKIMEMAWLTLHNFADTELHFGSPLSSGMAERYLLSETFMGNQPDCQIKNIFTRMSKYSETKQNTLILWTIYAGAAAYIKTFDPKLNLPKNLILSRIKKLAAIELGSIKYRDKDCSYYMGNYLPDNFQKQMYEVIETLINPEFLKDIEETCQKMDSSVLGKSMIGKIQGAAEKKFKKHTDDYYFCNSPLDGECVYHSALFPTIKINKKPNDEFYNTPYKLSCMFLLNLYPFYRFQDCVPIFSFNYSDKEKIYYSNARYIVRSDWSEDLKEESSLLNCKYMSPNSKIVLKELLEKYNDVENRIRLIDQKKIKRFELLDKLSKSIDNYLRIFEITSFKKNYNILQKVLSPIVSVTNEFLEKYKIPEKTRKFIESKALKNLLKSNHTWEWLLEPTSFQGLMKDADQINLLEYNFDRHENSNHVSEKFTNSTEYKELKGAWQEFIKEEPTEMEDFIDAKTPTEWKKFIEEPKNDNELKQIYDELNQSIEVLKQLDFSSFAAIVVTFPYLEECNTLRKTDPDYELFQRHKKITATYNNFRETVTNLEYDRDNPCSEIEFYRQVEEKEEPYKEILNAQIEKMRYVAGFYTKQISTAVWGQIPRNCSDDTLDNRTEYEYNSYNIFKWSELKDWHALKQNEQSDFSIPPFCNHNYILCYLPLLGYEINFWENKKNIHKSKINIVTPVEGGKKIHIHSPGNHASSIIKKDNYPWLVLKLLQYQNLELR